MRKSVPSHREEWLHCPHRSEKRLVPQKPNNGGRHCRVDISHASLYQYLVLLILKSSALNCAVNYCCRTLKSTLQVEVV